MKFDTSLLLNLFAAAAMLVMGFRSFSKKHQMKFSKRDVSNFMRGYLRKNSINKNQPDRGVCKPSSGWILTSSES